MTRLTSYLVACMGLLCISPYKSAADNPPVATLSPVRAAQCPEAAVTCQDFDAIVFVHGIYGGDDTFRNGTFDWPSNLPQCIQLDTNCRVIDIFKLKYRTAMLSWAKGNNPSLDVVASAVFDAMAPLRKRQYRSIGFIAHSLGGDVVSTYIVMLTERFSHPQRSQNGFVITLATPVLGSQIADIAHDLKESLFMSDPLLDALKKNNIYLTMLNDFRQMEVQKGQRYVCRPVHVHAAYEEKHIGPLLIVGKDSAAISISKLADSPIVGFPLNHIDIAKPANEQSPVYVWTMDRIKSEYARLAQWEEDHKNAPQNRRLCVGMDFIPE